MLSVSRIKKFQSHLPGERVRMSDQQLLRVIHRFLRQGEPAGCSEEERMLWDILEEMYGKTKKRRRTYQRV